MARGGVYDQLAGGFHRYSVDERWIVPHFEKMCYDNSELLKNYVHAYQATGDEFFAGVARDIIRWMDEWLSDRAHGGFYASQDADYSMDDDGDYFTWTLSEAKAVLTADETAVATAYYRHPGSWRHASQPGEECAAYRWLGAGDCSTTEYPGRPGGCFAGCGAEENVCGAFGASYAVCGQDGVRRLECDVRFGLSGGGEGA